MTAPQQIEAQNHTYSVVLDRTNVYRVLVTGSALDAVTGLPIVTFDVRATQRGLWTKTTNGGLFCVAGDPELVFPKLATNQYEIDLVLLADGYRTETLTVVMPAQTGFPIRLQPLDLDPLPARIAGRVVKSELDRNPASGAEVEFGGSPGAGVVGHVLGLGSPLAFPHAVGTAVQERDLPPAGAATTLEHDAAPGARTIALHELTNVGAQDLLCIDPDAGRLYVQVDPAWTPPANPAQPGDVDLTAELYRGFPARTDVVEVSPGAIGTVTHVARAARAGDGAVVLDDVLAAEAVEFADAPREEFRSARAVADGAGFYAFDGVSGVRVAELAARAVGAGAVGPAVTWTVAYGEPVNVVNLRAS